MHSRIGIVATMFSLVAMLTAPGAGDVASVLADGADCDPNTSGAIVGTSGPDVLVGTPGSDLIIGRGGDDEIRGLGGNDVLCGGSGDDLITGGSGVDRIFGGKGSDTIHGMAGADEIDAGDGDDQIQSGDGADSIDAGRGDDLIQAGPGNDVVEAGRGDDVVDGGAGDDAIGGSAGDDYLIGGSGSDAIDGEAGSDTCSDGNDELVSCESTSNTTVPMINLAGDDGRIVAADEITVAAFPEPSGPPITIAIDGVVVGVLESPEYTAIFTGLDLDPGDHTVTASWFFGTQEQLVVVEATGGSGEFQVVSPRSGAIVGSSSVSVVVEYEDEATISRIDIASGGQVIGSIAAPSRSAFLDVTLPPGGNEISLTSYLGDGSVGETQVITVTVLTGLATLSDVNAAFEDGVLSLDEYVLAALPLASRDPADESLDESTLQVLDLLLRTYSLASPETQTAVREMARVYRFDAGPALALESRVAAADIQCDLHTWTLGLIDGTYCELGYQRAGRPDSFKITYLVDESVLLDGIEGSQAEIVDALEQAALLMWEAQDTYEAAGFTLPEVHRGSDPVPITVFVVDSNHAAGQGTRAYSSPFRVSDESAFLFAQDYGHPIRVTLGALDDTIVHELFHTYEWDTINWTNDILFDGGNRNRTVALYESAANWGTNEVSRVIDGLFAPATVESVQGYNASVVRHWYADPTREFLFYDGGLAGATFDIASLAYAHFPGLVWLDENVGASTPPDGEASGVITAMIRAYDDSVFGVNPHDLIVDQVSAGRLANPGGQPLARAWPQMWAALYINEDWREVSAFDYAAVPWAFFADANARRWRSALDARGFADDYGSARPARVTPSPVAISLDSIATTDSISVERGGAAFVDHLLTSGGSATARVVVDHSGGSGPTSYEAFVAQFEDTPGVNDDLVLCTRGGDALIELSDPLDNVTQTSFSLALDLDCPKVTVGVTAVDLTVDPVLDPIDTFGITTQVVSQFAADVPAGSVGAFYAEDTLDLRSEPASVSALTDPPPGLILSSSGLLVGTPTSGGLFNVVVSLTDIYGQDAVDTFIVEIDGPFLTDLDTQDLIVGQPYQQAITVASGPSGSPIDPADVAVVGDPPPGVTVTQTPSGFDVAGIPQQAGSYSFVVTATDQAGLTSSATYSFVVRNPENCASDTGPSEFFDFDFEEIFATPSCWMFADEGSGTTDYSLSNGTEFVIESAAAAPDAVTVTRMFPGSSAGGVEIGYRVVVESGGPVDFWVTVRTSRGEFTGPVTTVTDADGIVTIRGTAGGIEPFEAELNVVGSGPYVVRLIDGWYATFF